MRHSPALTGLRGVGVLLVMWLHAAFGTRWSLPGGFLGVDLFFVLSGFLITRLLVAELEAQGRIDLRAFYARRALRLLPALGVTLVLVWVLRLVVGPVGGNLVSSTLATVLYVANWLQVVDPTATGYLDHTWSLAIEEQFYLAWPFLLAVALRRGVTPARLARWTALAVVAVLVGRWAAYAWHPGSPVSGYKLYYTNTFTRADSLLAGSTLGLLAPSAWKRVALLAPLGAVAFAVLVDMARLRAPFLLEWGLTASAISGLALVAAAASHSGPVEWLLARKPLVAVGEISYGLYLYHLPIVLALSTTDLETGPRIVLCFLLPFVMAVASYRLVERPALRYKHRFEPARKLA
jgi:peptidoglycan/LPS O-acetylase OafA/YrhL